MGDTDAVPGSWFWPGAAATWSFWERAEQMSGKPGSQTLDWKMRRGVWERGDRTTSHSAAVRRLVWEVSACDAHWFHPLCFHERGEHSFLHGVQVRKEAFLSNVF